MKKEISLLLFFSIVLYFSLDFLFGSFDGKMFFLFLGIHVLVLVFLLLSVFLFFYPDWAISFQDIISILSLLVFFLLGMEMGFLTVLSVLLVGVVKFFCLSVVLFLFFCFCVVFICVVSFILASSDKDTPSSGFDFFSIFECFLVSIVLLFCFILLVFLVWGPSLTINSLGFAVLSFFSLFLICIVFWWVDGETYKVILSVVEELLSAYFGYDGLIWIFECLSKGTWHSVVGDKFQDFYFKMDKFFWKYMGSSKSKSIKEVLEILSKDIFVLDLVLKGGKKMVDIGSSCCVLFFDFWEILDKKVEKNLKDFYSVKDFSSFLSFFGHMIVSPGEGMSGNVFDTFVWKFIFKDLVKYVSLILEGIFKIPSIFWSEFKWLFFEYIEPFAEAFAKESEAFIVNDWTLSDHILPFIYNSIIQKKSDVLVCFKVSVKHIGSKGSSKSGWKMLGMLVFSLVVDFCWSCKILILFFLISPCLIYVLFVEGAIYMVLSVFEGYVDWFWSFVSESFSFFKECFKVFYFICWGVCWVFKEIMKGIFGKGFVLFFFEVLSVLFSFLLSFLLVWLFGTVLYFLCVGFVSFVSFFWKLFWSKKSDLFYFFYFWIMMAIFCLGVSLFIFPLSVFSDFISFIFNVIKEHPFISFFVILILVYLLWLNWDFFIYDVLWSAVKKVWSRTVYEEPMFPFFE